MNFIHKICLLILLWSCSSERAVEVTPASRLDIQEVNPNKATALTAQNLRHLAQVYDLDPVLYTTRIKVQPGVFFSSPSALTLDTRYAENPNKLLSRFLYEEMRWWLNSLGKNKILAAKELQKIYPRLPAQAYQNLMACYLEWRALASYLGKPEADKIIKEFIYPDKLTPWTYKQILTKNSTLKKILEKYKLVPQFLLQKPTKNPPV